MLTQLSVTQMAAKLASKEISAVELAQAHLDAIEASDKELGAYLNVTAETALKDAAAAQVALDSGQAGPLTGIPYALKDNMSTQGIETTCASQILKGYIPPFNASVVDALRAQGLVMLGKTNLDEFAMGASTETSSYQQTRNPWDKERSPGGSSGGSAAAVAAGLAPIALGSDTGGSIRQPASLCGIVGFKPTYGRVSRYGLVAFASSLDQIGPFGRCVEDAALLANAISGHDAMDSTSIKDSKIDIKDLKSASLKGLRLAIPKEAMEGGVQDGVKQSLFEALDKLRSEGVTIDEVSIPATKFGVTTYYIIAPAEASSNLGRFDGIRYGPQMDAGDDGHIGLVARNRAAGFGKEVKTRIMVGTYALSAGYYDAYYLRATQVRTLMRQQMEEVMKSYDFIVGPTSPVVAFKLGELLDDPLALKVLDVCTIPANMGGFPAISLPVGLSNGLPVGMQLLGPNMGDERLLATSYAVERALGLTYSFPQNTR